MGGAATADRFQPRALGLDRIGVAEAIDDHIGAVGGKGLRDAEPDARVRSGAEGGFSFRTHGGVFSVGNGSVERSEEGRVVKRFDGTVRTWGSRNQSKKKN